MIVVVAVFGVLGLGTAWYAIRAAQDNAAALRAMLKDARKSDGAAAARLLDATKDQTQSMERHYRDGRAATDGALQVLRSDLQRLIDRPVVDPRPVLEDVQVAVEQVEFAVRSIPIPPVPVPFDDGLLRADLNVVHNDLELIAHEVRVSRQPGPQGAARMRLP